MNKKDKQQYIDIIKPMLTQKRFEHSLNVSEEAVKLAKKYGADTEKAELAGLLHDILKDTPPEKQLKILADFGIIMSDVELSAKNSGMPSAARCISSMFCTLRTRMFTMPCDTTPRAEKT